MNKLRTVLYVVLILVCEAVPASAQTAAPYKIGVTYPLTGTFARFAGEFLRGLEIGIDDVNRSGGVRGRPLQLLIEDSAATPQVAVAATRKLVQIDGVQAIVTGFTGVVTAQVPLGDQLKVPMISPIESPGIVDKSEFSFAHAATYERILPLVAADWRARHIKRIYGLIDNSAFGLLAAQQIRAAARDSGADYDEALLDLNQSDFRGLLERVREYRADAVILPGQGGPAEASAIRQLRELGIPGRIYVTAELFGTPSFRDAVGPYIEGTIFGGLYLDPNASASRAFVTEYKKRMGFVPSHGAAEMYDIAKILALAIERGGYDGAAIQHVLLSLKGLRSVMGGTITMGADHHTIINAVHLWQVRSGRLIRV